MSVMRVARSTLGIAAVATGVLCGCDSVAEPKPLKQSIDLFVGAGAQALAMDQGASIALTVVVRDSSGQALQEHPAVALVSRNPGVVTVDDNGVVTGKTAGSTYVVATMRETSGVLLADSMAIVVVPPPL